MENIQRKNGTKYRDRVTLPNGKVISKTFSRKTDLLNWKNSMLTEIAKNKALGLDIRVELTLEELFSEWHKQIILPQRSHKTATEYGLIYYKHFHKRFGTICIHQIKKSHILGLQTHLMKSMLSPKTINKIVGVLKTVLNYACRQDYLIVNPTVGIAAIRVTQKRLSYLSEAEVAQVLNMARFQDYYPIIVTALNTGMRIGEILGLCWDSVQWESETLEISRSLSRTTLNERTKTHTIRHIPMNSAMKELLIHLRKTQRNPKFVFVDEHGGPFRPDHFCQRIFHPLLEKAGVKKIRFHDLRHTFASLFMMKGGNIYDLQKILGHSSVTMTQVYAHLSPQHLQKAIQIVNFQADGLPQSCHSDISEQSNLVVFQR